MMKKFILFISLLTFLFAEVYTVKKIRVIRGEGYGVTREEAINNALVEALSQIKGVYISQLEKSKDSLIETDTKSSAKFTYSNKIKKYTAGKLNSYKIEKVEQIAPNKYHAIIIVTKITTRHKYKSPGHNPRKRRSLAVLPFEYKATYTLYGIPINGEALSNRITQSIINKLIQTRKFTILDRQNSKYYEFEKRFLLSGNTDPIELARLGKRFGADYFVIGQILDFGTDLNVEHEEYTGQTYASNSAYATISYRILNVPTQQIKWSDTIDIEFELPLKKRAESIVAAAGDRIAQVLVEQIIFNIYPPKIVRTIGANRAIVNMGGNFIHEGDKFEVYALGQKLIDPYTKEFLGWDEVYLGKVKVTRVLPKISYVQKIEGRIQKGAILRKGKKQQEAEDSVGKGSMFDQMFGN